MVKVKAFQISRLGALKKLQFQTFFHHNEGKNIQISYSRAVKELIIFFTRGESKSISNEPFYSIQKLPQNLKFQNLPPPKIRKAHSKYALLEHLRG